MCAWQRPHVKACSNYLDPLITLFSPSQNLITRRKISPVLCFAQINSKAVSKYDEFFIMLPFTLCSLLATMMQWNINDRTHIHSHGISNAVFLLMPLPAAHASFLLFHNQISVHIAPKAAKWKKEQAQSMRLWMYDCFSCVLRNVASLTRILTRSRWWTSQMVLKQPHVVN